jgi:hypothetical protein
MARMTCTILFNSIIYEEQEENVKEKESNEFFVIPKTSRAVAAALTPGKISWTVRLYVAHIVRV